METESEMCDENQFREKLSRSIHIRSLKIEDGMIDSVKGGRQVEDKQLSDLTTIHRKDEDCE